MRIAVLALQGAFAEHRKMLEKLGAEVFEVRQAADWNQPKDGLVIPGGESTTMLRLLHDLQLFNPIKEAITKGLPVFGTCAGLILLSNFGLGTMHIDVERNGYGRQLGSFHHEGNFNLLRNTGNTSGMTSGRDFDSIHYPMVFIRAPYIKHTGENVVTLAIVDDRIVAAQEDNQLATAFHPELTNDKRIHEYFLDIVMHKVRFKISHP